jgi:F420 biosynthesis protein FbiB-like protein
MSEKDKLAPAIGRRRSIRRYRPEPVGRAAIERLLLAATRAPSAHNRQPWRFAVIDNDDDTDNAMKGKLAAAMGERLRHDRTADGDDPQAIASDVARSIARVTEAPAVLVVCLDTRDMDQYTDERRRHAEYLMAVQSTAMAVQNILLAAEEEGLGACVMCAPLFCPDTVAAALQLPGGWQAQMLVTVGHPGVAGKDRARLPLTDVVMWPARR